MKTRIHTEQKTVAKDATADINYDSAKYAKLDRQQTMHAWNLISWATFPQKAIDDISHKRMTRPHTTQTATGGFRRGDKKVFTK